MQKHLNKLFCRIREEQKQALSPICPRCGKPEMSLVLEENCLSRDKNVRVYICQACGSDEKSRDHDYTRSKNQIRPSEWAAARSALEGRTFYDLLCSGQELNCGLIINNIEMPAPFAWDGKSPFTVHGIEYFGALLESPYKIQSDGKIRVYSDEHELGYYFTYVASLAMKGAKWRPGRFFGHMELTRNDIAIDKELTVEDNRVIAYIETWFDAYEKFGVKGEDNDDVSVDFYAAYYPHCKLLHCFYVVKNTGDGQDVEHKYYPTKKEAELIVAMMEETSAKEKHCTLIELMNDDNVNELAQLLAAAMKGVKGGTI